MIRTGKFWPVFVILVLLMAGATRASAQSATPEPVWVTLQDDEVSLGAHLQVLQDDSLALTIDQVSAPALAPRWETNTLEVLNFGTTDAAIWLRFRLRSEIPEPSVWLLELASPTVGYVDLFIQKADGYQEISTGARLPYSSRLMKNDDFVFPLTLLPGAENWIYLRVASDSTLSFPLTLWSVDAYTYSQSQEEFGIGLADGSLLALILINLTLFVLLKERAYLYLALFSLMVFINFSISEGRLLRWFPGSGGDIWQLVSAQAAILRVGFVLLFTQAFLELRLRMPTVHKWLQGLLWVGGVLMVVIILLPYASAFIWLNLYSVIALLSLTAAGIKGATQGYRPAQVFTLASIPSIFVSVIAIMLRLGAPLGSFFIQQIFLVGSLAQIILYSLALNQRIALIKNKTEEANQALRESESRVIQYLDAMPIGVAVVAPSQTVAFMNRYALRLVKHMNLTGDKKYTLGQMHAEMYLARKDEPYPREKLPVFRALKGQHARVEDIEIVHQGERIPLEMWANPIFDQKGTIISVIMVFQDISGRRKSEAAIREMQNLYQAVVDDQLDLVCRFRADGTLTFVNQAYQEFHRRSAAELVGTSVFERMPAERRLKVQREIEKSSPARQVTVDEVHQKNGLGQLRWLRWTIRTFFDENGKPLELQTVGQDITEQKRIQDELAAYRSHLEELVTVRTQEEKHQRQIAESLARISLSLNETLDLTVLLDRILAQLKRVIPYDGASVWLKEEQDLVLQRSSGIEVGLEDVRVPLEGNHARALVFKMGQPVVIANTQQDARWVQWYRDAPVRGWMGAPLITENESIGILMVESLQAGTYTDNDRKVLQAFASHAAIAVTNAWLYQQAQALAVLEERNRLARELHDAVSQTMFSASLIADSLPVQIESQPLAAIQSVGKLQLLTRGAQAELRTLLLELRPSSLNDVPLYTLLDNLCAALRGQRRISVEYQHSGDNCVLEPADLKVQIYRIAQEALHNVAHHARASHASVQLSCSDTGGKLFIEDDGCGYDPKSPPTGRMGLAIMKERARLIHARLEIDSQVGKGTKLRLEWRQDSDGRA